MPTSLMPVPKQQYFDSPNGRPLAGGKVYTYDAGTNTPKATYTDAAGTTPQANPIILNARGEPDNAIYWDGAYKVVLKDENDNVVYTVDNYRSGIDVVALGASSGASLVGYSGTTLDQILKNAVGKVVSSIGALRALDKTKYTQAVVAGYYAAGDGGGGAYYYDSTDTTSSDNGGTIIVANDGGRWKLIWSGMLSVRQFGAKLDGVADDTAKIQAAATAAAGKKLLFNEGTALISAHIELSNSTTVEGVGAASIIKLASGAINGFYATGKTRVVVRNLSITCSVAGTSAYVGGVKLSNCSLSLVENVAFVGMSWAGVMYHNTVNSSVVGCTFASWNGTVQDSSDICLYENANYNTIRGNFCYGGGDHGIFIQDPYTSATPLGNIIAENEVGEHNAYGIAVYVTTAYDTLTVISNNHVRDIKGSALGGASGAGIYIQSAGGTVVTGNTLTNCCRSTTNFETLGIGAISASVGEYGTGTSAQVVIANNHILAPRGPGIYALSSDNTIVIEGNTIRSTGVGAVRGEAILSSNVKAVKIANNSITHVNTNYFAVKVIASGAEYSYHQIVNNQAKAQGAGGFILQQSSGGFSQHCLVDGNTVWTAGGVMAYFIESWRYMRFMNNYGDSSGAVFYMQNCLQARISGNRLYSGSGGYAIVFAGTNTGSICDESNDFQATVENQAGNGTIISKYGNTAPAGSGFWDVGDRVIQSVPVVGQPKGWRCTVAGNPATFVSEGNL